MRLAFDDGGSGPAVVLLHGLGESPLNMVALEAALRLSGYAVANIAYPSTSGSTGSARKAGASATLCRRSVVRAP